MALGVQLCFLLFGTCLFSFLLLLECRKLEGYAFPVFSTKECPGNQAEWKNRSSAINCTESNGYMCLPNEHFTDLLEFCYIYPRILVQKDLCLYLVQRFSRVNSYNCRKFTNGCPESSYFSSETYIHPSCIEIENGCFSAEPSCKRQPLQSEKSIDDTKVAIILGVSIPICFLCILVFYVIRKKFPIRRRGSDMEMNMGMINGYETQKEYKENTIGRRMYMDERMPLLNIEDWETMETYKEYSIEKAMFDQWIQDDSYFISTKACEEVKKITESRSLVIVVGHSGSGKSAIIQHIALKYGEQGWTVRRVTKVEDIVNEKHSHPSAKIVFVFNDPFGKEYLDEILNNSWQTYEEQLDSPSERVKILMSCRSHIITDPRIARYLVNQSDIVDIDSEKYKLSVDEKRQILTRYTSDIKLSDKDCDRFVEVEKYFPLLCKLYSSEEYINKDARLFTEPGTVLKKEILALRKKDKGKYCALALLVLFNDDILLENIDTEHKFKHTLELCGLPENTPHSAIGDNLKSLKGFLVKNVENKYHFYHDLVMDVTTHVFGTYYPAETIEYADIGLFRRRIQIRDCEEHNDPFTFYLTDKYIEELGERFLIELIGNRFIDVVLNPSMKKKRVIEALKQIIHKNPDKLQLLFRKKEFKLEKPDLKQLSMSKLAFISLEKDITPLFVLIVFGHTDFSLECLKSAQQIIANSIDISLLNAVCCNGSMELFHMFSNDRVKKSLENVNNTWGGFHPIHIVSLYHNYEILEKLIMIGIDINSKSGTFYNWTLLHLAVCNDTQKYGDYNYEESGATRRDKTVQLLVSNGAIINLCTRDSASPLYIACQNGHDSTVQLLLSNGANINLCNKNKASPLYIACQNGHDSTVRLLVRNGAEINLCKEDGTSPFFIACQNGHVSIVQLLLNSGAKINKRDRDGYSPLHMACRGGHDSTVEILLCNKAEINLCNGNRSSPLHIACLNRHDNIVKQLLLNRANINLLDNDKYSPLHLACQSGRDTIVQHLLSSGANINHCGRYGYSPLHFACQKGHDNIVQKLLSSGADINLCGEDGYSPLQLACKNGRDTIVQQLLSSSSRADINYCGRDGYSPLHFACLKGHDTIVQQLLKSGADINLCAKDGYSPLHLANQNKRDTIVQQLLSSGANN